MFSGDLVYVDRLLGVLPWSSVKNGQQAFHALAAARKMEPLSATLDRYADLPAFRHLGSYADLHRANISRACTELESQ